MNYKNLLFPLSGALIGSGVEVFIRNIVNYVKFNEFKKIKLRQFLNIGMLIGFMGGVRLNTKTIETESVNIEDVPVNDMDEKDNFFKDIIEKEN